MAANSLENLAKQLIKQAKAEPQKASVLAVLLVIMIVAWARMGGGAPGASKALATVDPRAASGLTTDNYRLPSKGNTGFPALVEWADRPIAPQLTRNPFVVNYDFFPQDGSKPAPPRLSQGDGFWDQLAKSMTSRADQKMERDLLADEVRRQASNLKLQSTMMGASPKALIDGVLVGEGDVVASFRVLSIEARRIVVEQKGIKLEIRLN
jgi:hypothetical protein